MESYIIKNLRLSYQLGLLLFSESFVLNEICKFLQYLQRLYSNRIRIANLPIYMQLQGLVILNIYYDIAMRTNLSLLDVFIFLPLIASFFVFSVQPTSVWLCRIFSDNDDEPKQIMNFPLIVLSPFSNSSVCSSFSLFPISFSLSLLFLSLYCSTSSMQGGRRLPFCYCLFQKPISYMIMVTKTQHYRFKPSQ